MRKPHLSRPIALVGATAILAGGSVLVAASAFGEDEPSEPTPSAPAKHGHRAGPAMLLGFDADALSKRIGDLPPALREDLAQVLTTDDETQRATLIEAMKDKAAAGDYGAEVKKLVDRAGQAGQRWRDHAKGAWADLPQALKDDLVALRDLDHDERKAALAKIIEGAKAGEYGDDITQKADRLGRFGGSFGAS